VTQLLKARLISLMLLALPLLAGAGKWLGQRDGGF
jgi:hypothetical protein